MNEQLTDLELLEVAKARISLAIHALRLVQDSRIRETLRDLTQARRDIHSLIASHI